MSPLTSLLLVSLVLVSAASASNILMLAALGTKSHMNFFGEIAKTLADTGHQVTVVSGYKTLAHDNVTAVDSLVRLEPYMDNNINNRNLMSYFSLISKTRELCHETLGGKAVQKLKEQDFDLVFMSGFMNHCFLSFLDRSETPLIFMVPNTIVTILHEFVGNVDFPAFVPLMGVRYLHPFTFWQRTKITVISTISIISTRLYGSWLEQQCKDAGLCKEDMEPFLDIAKRSSLIFINSVRSLEYPARPYVPSVIHAGGLNCRPAQPLPQELESWIQGAGGNGFIYISFGTAIKPSTMSEEFRHILVSVFASLPQRIIWKWDEETMLDLPPNVKLASWLPQQDILGHPNIKLFISHGGLFSTLEATYHGAPILGMPVILDQATNIVTVVSEGWGEMIEWDDLTENLFRETILKIINNKRYTDVVRHRSRLMLDQPLTPQETVVYWTDYVLRHDGARHLSSPVREMSWCRLYNMDVWAVVVASAVTCLWLLWKLVKCLVLLSWRLVKRLVTLTWRSFQQSHRTKDGKSKKKLQ